MRFYRQFDEETWQSHGQRPEDYRTAFEIDRDRIIHTASFRRLQSKTQVFLSGEYDFYRTRLTHSIEVAQIGRAICRYLARQSPALHDDLTIDDALVEGACLAHDLGHPPFGHTGEKTLNELMADHGGFEGNAQTLRLLTKTIYGGRRGMGPTRALLDAVLKYKSCLSELKGKDSPHPANHFIYDDQQEVLDFVFADQPFPIELTAGKIRDHFRSIECQIMDWADDTAYSLNDILDGVHAGFLTPTRIQQWMHEKENALDDDAVGHLQQLIKWIEKGNLEAGFGKKIGAFISACSLEEDANFMSHLTNRYRYQLVVANEVTEECKLYKHLAYEVVFCSHVLKQMEYKADKMLRALFDAFANEYRDGRKPQFRLLPPDGEKRLETACSESERMRLLCDYLAGMTDGFATRTWKRLHDPNFGSIMDMV